MGKRNEKPAAKKLNRAGREIGGNRNGEAVVLSRLDAVSSLIAAGKSSRAIVVELSQQFNVHEQTVQGWLRDVRQEMRRAAKDAIKHRFEICLADTIRIRDEAKAEKEYGTAGAMQKELNALLGAHQASAAQIELIRTKAEAAKAVAIDVDAMTSGQLRALLAEILAADKTAPG